MGGMARIAVAAPLAVALVYAAFEAAEYGLAGSAYGNAERELARMGASPPAEPVWWRADLERALHRVPDDPSSHEVAAITTLRLTNSPDELATAERHLVAAIAARPASGYAWASLATVKYRLGDTGPSFERAVVNAVRLAPYEPEVQQAVADYGLAVIDELKQPAARAAIERAVAAGMKRNPPEILQISARRGRLDIACRHFDGETRPAATKWTQLCQSMEATP